MKYINCPVCKKSFATKRINAKFCCKVCYLKYSRGIHNLNRRKPLQNKNCILCNEAFQTAILIKKVCRKCKAEWSNERRRKRIAKKPKREDINCLICKKSFTPKQIATKACSKVCRQKYYDFTNRKPTQKKNCIICNEVFQAARVSQIVCGKECGRKRERVMEEKWIANDKIKKDPIKKRKRLAKIRKRRRERIKSDVCYKIKILLSSRLRTALKRKSVDKKQKTLSLLGCSIDYFKDYIAAKFEPGMSWDNHGVWHLDHIKPCASFDLRKIAQQKKCFHYTNFQPLLARENIIKGASLDW